MAVVSLPPIQAPGVVKPEVVDILPSLVRLKNIALPGSSGNNMAPKPHSFNMSEKERASACVEKAVTTRAAATVIVKRIIQSSLLEVVELKIDFVDLEGLRSIALKGNPHVSERLNR
jgi:hypothetical protein